jgi:hypothetical protein
VIRLRLWILGAAVGCFAAGMTIGLLIPRTIAGASLFGVEDSASDEDYVARFALDFGLTSQQEHQLRCVRAMRRLDEFEVLKAADFAKLPPELQSQVLAARSREEARIRGLLDDKQRQRYEELAQSGKGK